jgi:protease-4
MENEVNIDGKPVAWERATIEKLVLAQVREQRAARRWRMLRTLLWLALFGALVWLLARDQWSAATVPSGPHTALVTIRGEIADRSEASAESVLPAMRSALEDSAPRRWCCCINSPGGSPVQAGMINDEIRRLRKLHGKPIYAVVEETCASAAYYIAAAADEIYVDKASIVGSIGVLMDGFGFTGTMDKLGVERRLLTAGANKGFLDPFSPQTETQRQFAQAMLDQIHQQFIDSVKRGRGERLKATPRPSAACSGPGAGHRHGPGRRLRQPGLGGARRGQGRQAGGLHQQGEPGRAPGQALWRSPGAGRRGGAARAAGAALRFSPAPRRSLRAAGLARGARPCSKARSRWRVKRRVSNSGAVGVLAASRWRRPRRVSGSRARRSASASYSSAERVISSGRPTASSRLAAMRPAKVWPGWGQHRQAGPQRVADGGAAVEGQGVQKQIGLAVLRQVLRVGPALGKHQPLGRHAARLRLGAQVLARRLAVAQQPQHGLRQRVQQAHPAVEHPGVDLVRVVQAAEHEAVPGQAQFGARGGVGGDGARIVVGLERVGQAHDVLGKGVGLVAGRDPAVAEDVVHLGHARGAGIARVLHLDGRRPPRQDAGAGVGGQAVEVDQDVDPVLGDQARRLGVAQRVEVDEVLERRLRAPALGRVVGLRVGGEREGLEAAAVMGLEHAGHQVADGVRAQVGRQVAQAQAPPGRLWDAGAADSAAPGFRRRRGPGWTAAGRRRWRPDGPGR